VEGGQYSAQPKHKRKGAGEKEEREEITDCDRFGTACFATGAVGFAAASEIVSAIATGAELPVPVKGLREAGNTAPYVPKANTPFANESVDTPTAAGTESPVAGTESPMAGTESPVAGTESPLAGTEFPVAGTESPMAGTEPPLAETEFPVAGTDGRSRGGTPKMSLLLRDTGGGTTAWGDAGLLGNAGGGAPLLIDSHCHALTDGNTGGGNTVLVSEGNTGGDHTALVSEGLFSNTGGGAPLLFDSHCHALTDALSLMGEGTPLEGTPLEGTTLEGTPLEGTPLEGTPLEGTPLCGLCLVSTGEADWKVALPLPPPNWGGATMPGVDLKKKTTRGSTADDDMYTTERHLAIPGQRGQSPQRHTAAGSATPLLPLGTTHGSFEYYFRALGVHPWFLHEQTAGWEQVRSYTRSTRSVRAASSVATAASNRRDRARVDP